MAYYNPKSSAPPPFKPIYGNTFTDIVGSVKKAGDTVGKFLLAEESRKDSESLSEAQNAVMNIANNSLTREEFLKNAKDIASTYGRSREMASKIDGAIQKIASGLKTKKDFDRFEEKERALIKSRLASAENREKQTKISQERLEETKRVNAVKEIAKKEKESKSKYKKYLSNQEKRFATDIEHYAKRLEDPKLRRTFFDNPSEIYNTDEFEKYKNISDADKQFIVRKIYNKMNPSITSAERRLENRIIREEEKSDKLIVGTYGADAVRDLDKWAKAIQPSGGPRARDDLRNSIYRNKVKEGTELKPFISKELISEVKKISNNLDQLATVVGKKPKMYKGSKLDDGITSLIDLMFTRANGALTRGYTSKDLWKDLSDHKDSRDNIQNYKYKAKRTVGDYKNLYNEVISTTKEHDTVNYFQSLITQKMPLVGQNTELRKIVLLDLLGLI